MRAIIIGNAKQKSSTVRRQFIDSSDIVIRLNGFRIRGYENLIGSKIDIIGIINAGDGAIKMRHEIKQDLIAQASEIWFSRPESFGKKPQQLLLQQLGDELRKRVVYPTQSMFQSLYRNCTAIAKEAKYPSTGMVIIEMALERFNGADIFITGFDQFQTGHYYSTKKVPKSGHPVIGEKALIKHYEQQGKLRRLD